MRHVLLVLLFFSGVHGSLDRSLTSKKSGQQPSDDAHAHDHAQDHDHSHDSQEVEVARTNDVEDVSDSSDDQVPENDDSPAAAIVAPVTVRSTCTVKRCLRDKHFHIVEEAVLPSWYSTYMTAMTGKTMNTINKDFTYHYFNNENDVPLWKHDDVDFCFQLHQVGDKTHYSSYFMKIPANRRYFLVAGTVRYADEEADKHPETHEDACDGDVQIHYKFIMDFWRTGDDYTKFPTAPKADSYIDDYPHTHKKSVVNYREGQWEFSGKLLLYIYKWHNRQAYFVVDVTLLELADDNVASVPTLNYKQILAKNIDPKEPAVGFWVAMDESDSFTDIKSEQRVRLFGKQKQTRRGVNTIVGVKFLSQAVDPITTDIDERKKIAAQQPSLSKLFQYNKPMFLLPIVACGIFAKDFPRPKNCEGKAKPEREG